MLLFPMQGPCGGIGRRGRLKIYYLLMWEFESPRGHHASSPTPYYFTCIFDLSNMFKVLSLPVSTTCAYDHPNTALALYKHVDDND